MLKVLTLLAVLVSVDACKSVPRDECADSRRRPIRSPEERETLLNSKARSFSGLVVDTYTKRPLSGVRADLVDLHVSQWSDSLGVFRFPELPVGWHRVQLRRVGFESVTDSVQISALLAAAAVYELSIPRHLRCQTVITS